MRKVPINEIKVGDYAEITKQMSENLVNTFAEVSEDYNPIHLDTDYAEKSRYKRKIIHGLMAVSLFSGLFGSRLPGEGSVYKSHNLRFRRPIYIGDTVTARIEVTSVNAQAKVITFNTRCLVKGKVMIDGESEIFVP